MSRTIPRMTNLFRQLGLDSDEHAIAEFIHTHQIEDHVGVADAPFWNTGQRQFLAEQLKVDAPWAITVDQLSEALRADAARTRKGAK